MCVHIRVYTHDALVVPLTCQFVFIEIMSREMSQITHSSFRQSGKIIDSEDVRCKDLTDPVPSAPPFLGHSIARNAKPFSWSFHRAEGEAGQGARSPDPMAAGPEHSQSRVLPELQLRYVQIKTPKDNEEERTM